ncbi:unnamed protein product, partial [Symbiodinium necroappetens]
MLGGAGLDWEVIWLWLVVVLAADVVGYFFRGVQAAWMKRQISVTDPAISIVMSVFPVLGPRVDLLKDCLFAGAVFQLAACQADGSWRRTAGFRVGNAALLTIFLPAPALHGPYLYAWCRWEEPEMPEMAKGACPERWMQTDDASVLMSVRASCKVLVRNDQ